MPDPTKPAEPIGTPPAGGRWTWDGAQWVRLPEDTPNTLAPQAPASEE